MLLFYGTLGSAMPYLPMFYKQLGVSGTSVFGVEVWCGVLRMI
jgi:hypothetical protein